MLLGALWGLLLGLKDECNEALEAKLKTKKDDVTEECERLLAVLAEVRLEGILPCFEVGEGVTKFFLLVLRGVSEEDSE